LLSFSDNSKNTSPASSSMIDVILSHVVLLFFG